MPRALRYMTYTSEELDAAFRRVSPQHFSEGGLIPAAPSPVSNRGSRLIHEHTLAVSFPDGAGGTCRYVRKAPNFHQFHYRHTSGLDGLTTNLPILPTFERMQNTQAVIEEAILSKTAQAFAAAIEQEKREYFRRATRPTDGSRAVDPTRFQMTANQARIDAGKYAVCIRIGRKYLPIVIKAFENLDEANAAWQKANRTNTVVCGLSRLDRAWKPLRYNPIYGVLTPSVNTEDLDR